MTDNSVHWRYSDAEVHSWIRPEVFPPTTQSTRPGCEAVTAGTAVTPSLHSPTIFSPVPENTSSVRFMFPTVKWGMYSVLRDQLARKIVSHRPVWQSCLIDEDGLKCVAGSGWSSMNDCGLSVQTDVSYLLKFIGLLLSLSS
jgi:hypothetical protein